MDLICSPEDLTTAYQWICDLRVDYSPNNDIWDLRRHWGTLKETLFEEINAGTYQFSSLDIYEFEDALISLWSGLDMIALKLITNALFAHFTAHFPHTCYHVKDRGGLKKAVKDTVNALSHEVSHEGVDGVTKYHYIFRSDVKSYYESIDFEILIGIIEQYVDNPILITLIKKALERTECKGGLYSTYDVSSLPMGSPLSPLLGAIALLPLDQAMGSMGGSTKNIFYARYMDDWIVLTKTKTLLRKVIKKTHQIMADLKLRLHPTKTYIGKISHGFNFLGYYIDDKTLLPSSETIRRMSERASALYERGAQKRCRRTRQSNKGDHHRDISEYQANEPKPNDVEWATVLAAILERAKNKPEVCASLRRYVTRWGRWLMLGLGQVNEHFEACLKRFLPQLMSLALPTLG